MNQQQIESALFNAMTSSVEDCIIETSKEKQVQCHRIKYKGQYIQLRSRKGLKTVWKNIGAAKSVLRCHLQACPYQVLGYNVASKIDSKEIYKAKENAWQRFLEDFEFVPVDAGD